MIEKTVIDYLRDNRISAYAQVPQNKTPFGAKFVVIEKTGGTLSNLINDSVIAVQSYAPSIFEAAELDEKVKGLMMALPDNSYNVSGIRLIGNSNFTDPDTLQPRYQSVFEVYHY